MDQDTLIKIRIESLKLAYQTAYQIGGFSTVSLYSMKDTTKDFRKDIKDVFELADLNVDYLCKGLYPKE